EYDWYCGRWCVLLSLYRPTDEALRFLAEKGGRLNYVEIACDACFASQPELNAAKAWFDAGWVLPYHKRSDTVNFYQNTRYSSHAGRPRVTKVYREWRPGGSRVSEEPEPYTLRLEVKFTGSRTIEAAGLSLARLPGFDFGSFWSRYLRV